MKDMSQRIIECRALLANELRRLNTPGDWSHITSQIGMFSYTGLTGASLFACNLVSLSALVAQCQQMKKKHHVYLLDNGRISMAGVNTHNVAYLASAIDDVVRNF